MNRSFFHAILFIAMLCVGLSFVSTRAEAALDIHAGYANDWASPQGDELPYTYGETVIENMWTSGRWVYSTHSIFIGNYAGGTLARKILISMLPTSAKSRGRVARIRFSNSR